MKKIHGKEVSHDRATRVAAKGFGDLDLKKGVDHDLKLEKGEVWNKI